MLSLEMNARHISLRTWRFQPYLLKDPDFITYMNNHIDIFLETNLNSASHSIIWESLKAYTRGRILSYSSHKVRERTNMLDKLENGDEQPLDITGDPRAPEVSEQIGEGTLRVPLLSSGLHAEDVGGGSG